jgi:hypothetical protein
MALSQEIRCGRSGTEYEGLCKLFRYERCMFKRHKLRGNSGNIAEFPLAMYCFLLVVVFPMIDLVGLATGFATIYLSTNECATRAANQRRYADSLDGMEQTAQQFLKTGMADFARMKPIGGYSNCGAALYIDASNYRTNSLQSYGPNTPVPPPIDLSNFLYECRVNSSFEVGPTIDLSFLPGLGSVPGLGKPAILNMSASKQAEYPIGLEGAAQQPSNGSVPPFDTTASPNAANSGPQDSGWNLPSVYDQIAAAGKTVVSTTVLQVQSTNPNWTATTVNVGPGQTLWIDLRSNGQWANSTGAQLQNANGVPAQNIPSWWWGAAPGTVPMATAPPAMLIGKVGSSQPFEVGSTYQNYAPGQNGQLSLIFNDNYYYSDYGANVGTWGSGFADNTGVQTVRVILAQ